MSAEKPSKIDKSSPDRLADTFGKIAGTAERVGLPVATFTIGAIAVIWSTQVQISILPWLGGFLIVTSLVTYVWLTARSTARVQPVQPGVPSDLKDQLDWMRERLNAHDNWMMAKIDKPTEQQDEETYVRLKGKE